MRSITVAFATFRESVRQPSFYTLLVIGVLLLFFSYILPTFQLEAGEVKFVRDIGLGTFALVVLLLGIFSSSNLITTEIENKTAMTVMSKPLRRHEFIIGKFMGIALSMLFLTLLLTAVFIPIIFAKVMGGDIVLGSIEYDSVWHEVFVVWPGIALAVTQALVLVAVSVAISTRLPMILNVSISFALYMLASVSGPLVNYIRSRAPDGSLLTTVKAVYIILPNFGGNTEIFSMIGLGKTVPVNLVLLALLYSALYITAALGVGVFLFQDRELG